jgi:DNA invertase Pin-like site-specific DNA recombinase
MLKKRTHKLTLQQKREIRRLVEDGFSPNAIAKQFNVSRITVYRISHDDRYKE